MDKKTTELTIKILNQTHTVLQKMCSQTNLTAGEVIDRIVLELCPTDVELAQVFILDYILLSTANLEGPRMLETICKVLQTIQGALTKESPAEIRQLLELLTSQLFLKLAPGLPQT